MNESGQEFIGHLEKLEKDMGKLTTNLANITKSLAAIRGHVSAALDIINQERPDAGNSSTWGGPVHHGGESETEN